MHLEWVVWRARRRVVLGRKSVWWSLWSGSAERRSAAARPAGERPYLVSFL